MSAAIPELVRGEGSRVSDAAGRSWLDLGISFGAVFLGHGHAPVVEALQSQAARIGACGRHPGEWDGPLHDALQSVLPSGMAPGPLVSTGMEAAEFALRIAAAHTGRGEFAGFAHSMHGKSAATASLCWANAPVRTAGMHLLPYLDNMDEDGIVRALEACLASRRIAAVLVEPIQGSFGGREPSAAFHAEVMARCRAHGTLCIWDEILTGLWRTGRAFHCEALPQRPDLLLFAKSMGNGFPVSSVALGPGITVTPAALPGSTFANNPLAKAAAVATLRSMAALPMLSLVRALEEVARVKLRSLPEHGVTVRGRGALWCLDCGDAQRAARVAAQLQDEGLLATMAGGVLRLLPCATLPSEEWGAACEQVVRAFAREAA